MEIHVRSARAEDHSRLVDFTRDTFSWGDYVADEFPRWLADPDGAVLVATDADNRPVGVARVVRLSSAEAWLHAARVDPAFRRQGIGSRLNEACVEWARREGALVARLLIEEWNQVARGQVEKLGYRGTARWGYARRRLTGGPAIEGNGGRRVPGEERLQPVDAGEAELAFVAWSSGDMVQAARGLFPLGWALRQMTVDDAVRAARSGALLECPSGWAIAAPRGEDLHTSWLVTNDEDAPALVRALLDRALDLEVAGMSVMSPRLPWLTATLERYGMVVEPSIVYARPIA